MNQLRYFYLALSLLPMLFFPVIQKITGDANLPPLDPRGRFWINLIFLNLWAAYAWVLADRARGLSRRLWMFLGFCGLLLCAVGPVFSGDVYEYMIRGRIFGVYHDNPYAHTSGGYPQDIFYPLSLWHGVPENYGPVWVLIQWAAPTLFGASVQGAVLAHKIVMFVFLVLSAVIFNRIARAVFPDSAGPLTRAFALNPNLAVQHLIDGHNDIAMVFFMLLAVYFLVRGRGAASLAAGMGAVLVKFSSVFILPALLIAHLRSCRGPRLPAALKAAAAAAGVAALLYAPFWLGRDTFRYFFIFKEWFYTNSFPYAVWRFLEFAGLALEKRAVAAFFLVFFAANCAAALWWLARGRFEWRRLFRALVWMFVALHASYAIPLYGNHLSWGLAFLLLGGFPRPVLLAGLYTFAGVFAYFKRLSFLLIGAGVLYAAALLASQRPGRRVPPVPEQE